MTKKKRAIIDEKLQIAYQQALYYVFDPPALLKVGTPQDRIDQLLIANDHPGAAYITAYNPLSVQLTKAENILRQQSLIRYITQKGWPYYPGQSLDPKTEWPAESAVLVTGISIEEALKLGQAFQQNAILYHRLGAQTELLWCL